MNGQLTSFEVDILDAKLKAFEQAHAAAMEHGDDEARRAAKLCEYRSDLGTSQDGGHGRRRAHPRDGRERGPEHVPVQEDQCRQRLVLGGRTHLTINRQRG